MFQNDLKGKDANLIIVALKASDVFKPQTDTVSAHFASRVISLAQIFKLTVSTSEKMRTNINLVV